MPDVSVAEHLADCLRRSGVSTIFGQSIPSPLLQAAPRFGIRQVGYRTENAGGVMADGFARVSGTLGVVAAQNGPAAALLVAPLAEALKASIPMLALVQDVSRADAGRNAFQELDHRALFAGCTKWFGRVDSPDQLEERLATAIRNATGGRPGPVVLMLPMDLLREPSAPGSRRAAVPVSYPFARGRPAASQIEAAAEIISRARRPLVVAGGGVHLSDATDALARLQDEFSLPVATTNMGKGAVSDAHPVSIGVIGNCMGRSAPSHDMAGYVSQADVVVFVGTRTNQNGTDSWRLFDREARFVHIDVDPAEIGRNYDSLPLIGDARETLAALSGALRATSWPDFEDVSDQISASRKAASRDLERRTSPGNAGVRPEAVMAELEALLPRESVVCADASYSTNWVATYLSARSSETRFLMPRGLAGLGWGLPMAMGAKVARPDSTVVAVAGDGGFGHCWSELEAAQREGIPVLVIVLSNRVLGYQKHAEDREYGGSTAACEFLPVDHAQIARACGCRAATVTRHEDIAPVLRAAFDDLAGGDGPVLIDVVTDPDAIPPLGLFEPAADGS